ncbi:hypothetical protein MMC07_007271 [Pseudocyphellaria aurata]|nr:hypothetical protein [Pseudocyphellaria aurata]
MDRSSASTRRKRAQSTAKSNLKKKEAQLIDLTSLPSTEFPASEPPTKKRKVVSAPALKKGKKQAMKVSALDGDEAGLSTKKMKEDPPVKVVKAEKRRRMFRKKAPLTYMAKLERATSQRMFVIERTRGGTDDVPEEMIVLAGSTGNLYNINIGLVPSCTCPDHKNGNQCKHTIYVLHNVLKAPAHLEYQLAFISPELREIFSHAPQLPSYEESDSSGQSNNRKEISGDCPICFTEFEPGREEIVWCKAACGNNIHKTCFQQWAKSQDSRTEVRCVFCRTPWQGETVSTQQIKATGQVNSEGYVNVASQLGISGNRGSDVSKRCLAARSGVTVTVMVTEDEIAHVGEGDGGLVGWDGMPCVEKMMVGETAL